MRPGPQLVEASNVPWRATHVLRQTCHLRHKDMQIANRYIDRSGASNRVSGALES